nr:hypothetical protein [Tanacetum cinerariifolium]
MIGCKVTRTLASVKIEIMLILGLPCCLSSSSVRCLGSARTPESPHIVAPPTCHVKESEGSGTSGARSTSLDSIDYTYDRACSICDVTGLSSGIAEVAAMSDLTFHNRFRSSYDSLPSPTLLVQKRYRGTSELILGTDSKDDEEVEEILDSDSKSEGVEDKGPTVENEDPAARDEGLVARVKGLDANDESYGLDDESYGLDDKIHGVDDESRGLDNEGRSVEIDRLGLKDEEEAVPGGQQQAALVVGTAVSAPLGLGYGALRC